VPVLVSNGLSAAEKAESEDEPGAAAAYLRGVLELQPWRGDLWLRAGLDSLAAGDDAAGVLALEQARGLDGLSGSSLTELGDAYARLGQMDQGVAAWRAAVAAGQPLTPLYERIYAAERASGEIDRVVAVLREWQLADPADARVLYRLGLYRAVEQPDEAIALLRQAAEKSAELAPMARVTATNLESALLEPPGARRLVMIGRALGEINEWELAGLAFERAVNQDAANAEAWALWGEAKQQRGQSGQAELEKALALAPDSVLARALQAVALRRAGKPEEALAHLRAAAAAEPENGFWWVEIGNTQVAQGDLGAAMESYIRAVDLEPGNPLYWRALAGFCFSYQVDVERIGLPAARQAAALAPGDPANLDGLGVGLAAVGDLVSAERAYLQALAVTPNYAPALLHLGMLYMEQRDYDQAHSRLNAAAQQSADPVVADQARRLLARYFAP
jgi:tetratricopeptide (TPR) repeat protein